MELDKRIKSLSDILTCFDIEEAKQFIGQKGYFSDTLCDFSDLIRSNRKYNILTEVRDHDLAFVAGYGDNAYYGRFFIPKCNLIEVKKKKCRPLTLDEFKNRFAIGDVIKLRLKDCSLDLCLMYTGNDPYCDSVCLGSYSFSMQTLFDDYEYYFEVAQKWLPFGVENEIRS